MLPVPSRYAVCCFAAGTALALLGLALQNAQLVVLAGGLFVGLALTFAASVAVGTRLRRERLDFSWWHSHEHAGTLGGAAARGVPFQVRCLLRNHAQRAVHMRHVRAVLSEGLTLLTPNTAELWLPARSRGELKLTLRAEAAGRAVLHGLSVTVPGPLGLFLAPLYFAIPLTVRVLPRAATLAHARALNTSSLPVERSGAAALRRPGSGTELRELRELRPGDPFKSIAWKNSAKLGRFVVREVEREVQHTLCLVLDVGGSVRAGAPGKRMLDQAIELATLSARAALDRGERVGLTAFDERTLVQVAPGEGPSHMIRIYDGLLQLTELVDEDCTQLADAEIVARVARYLRLQEALELPSGKPPELQPLLRHVRRALQAESQPREVRASSEEFALLRRFCRLRGIGLGHRATLPEPARTTAFAQALLAAGGAAQLPRTIHLFSDLEAVGLDERVARPLKLLRAQRHALGLWLLDPASHADAPAPGLAADLHSVLTLPLERRNREARRFFGGRGVTLRIVRGTDTPALALRSVARPRSAA